MRSLTPFVIQYIFNLKFYFFFGFYEVEPQFIAVVVHLMSGTLLGLFASVGYHTIVMVNHLTILVQKLSLK